MFFLRFYGIMTGVFLHILIFILVVNTDAYVNIPNSFSFYTTNKLNNIMHECSQSCSLSSKSLDDCWKPTLAFYESILLGLMREFVSIQVISNF